MKLRTVLAVVLGAGLMPGGLAGSSAHGAVLPGMDGMPSMPVRVAGQDFVEAQQYKVADGRVPGGPGQVSMRQRVTAWQVDHGMWNGQVLDGLSLVLVQSIPEDGTMRPFTNCYISHVATPAQRRALVNAYAASQPQGETRESGASIRPADTASWRIEPAVIRFEFFGGRVVVHLGTIA